jgi:salicylate hydroxylase
VRAAFDDPTALRRAPWKIFRAIIPTEKLLADEKSKSVLAITKNKFALFSKDDRAISWFEGRE